MPVRAQASANVRYIAYESGYKISTVRRILNATGKVIVHQLIHTGVAIIPYIGNFYRRVIPSKYVKEGWFVNPWKCDANGLPIIEKKKAGYTPEKIQYKFAFHRFIKQNIKKSKIDDKYHFRKNG